MLMHDMGVFWPGACAREAAVNAPPCKKIQEMAELLAVAISRRDSYWNECQARGEGVGYALFHLMSNSQSPSQ